MHYLVKWRQKSLVLKFQSCSIQMSDSQQQEGLIIFVEMVWDELIKQKMQDYGYHQMKMFYTMSHELRTPLNCSISNMICLESVLQKLHQQPIIDQYITPSLISNKLMLNNINDMLDMVQIDEGKLKISKMNF